MKIIKIVLSLLLLIAVALAGLYGYFLYTPAPTQPSLSAALQQGQITLGERHEPSSTPAVPDHLRVTKVREAVVGEHRLVAIGLE